MQKKIGTWVIAALVFTAAVWPCAAVEIYAHRASRGLWPENSMEAVIRTLALGVETLELDVAVTRDLKAVVHHDPYLSPYLVKDRDGLFVSMKEPLLLKDLTYEQILDYTIGEMRPRSLYAWFFRMQKSVPDQPVPLLEDIFVYAASRKIDNISYTLEIKTYPEFPHLTHELLTIVTVLGDVIDRYDLWKSVTIISFDWRVISLVRELYPDVSVGCVASTRSRFKGRRMNLNLFERGASSWLDGLDADDYNSIPDLVKAFGSEKLFLNHKDLTPSLLVRARELEIEVVVWTVNSRLLMKRYVQWGVDGIITDRPDVLKDVLIGSGTAE